MVASRSLRIVFFGTPDFSVPTLDALFASRHAVVGVVTQPDRPRGRGQKTSDSPVKARARVASVPVLQPTALKHPGFVADLQAFGADLGVVAAYGRILPDVVLRVPPLGLINVHASLLPKYRGAAPVHRAVIAGEAETGVTIMRIVKALDAGPMMARASRLIGPDETSMDVEHDLARLGADLLVDVADALASGGISETPQDDSASSYAPLLTKGDGRIDWTRPALAIHNQVRGLHPWPHAYAFVNGHRLIVRRTRVTDDAQAGAPGTILLAHGEHLLVATGAEPLALLEIQAEGKRPMSAREFLAGHPLTRGDRFMSEA
jgi:methionyl-tRNA formyltransferase